jgi:hypothetical protein
MARLRDLDRASGVPVRYVRDHPREWVHLDMKLLPRGPDGDGHRALGRSPVTRHRGARYEVVHVAIDGVSRLAFAQIQPDGRGLIVARFLLDAVSFIAEQGVRVERV